MQKEVVHILTIILLLLLFTKLTFDTILIAAVLIYVLQSTKLEPSNG